jgi:RNA 2',3'-cyclic 3'-phosphodiesterase
VTQRHSDARSGRKSEGPPVFRSARLPLSSSSWRIFCAIDISEDLRARVTDYIEKLCQAVPDASASWSRSENIHLTLKFFGDVERDLTENLSRAAARVAEESAPFQISVGNTATFPKHGQPRVLWIGVEDPSYQLINLQQRLENECAREGFPKEERAFRPHLTLARIRRPHGSRTLGEIHRKMGFAAARFVVSELLLIRSELSSEGSKYTLISRHRLEAQRAES